MRTISQSSCRPRSSGRPDSLTANGLASTWCFAWRVAAALAGAVLAGAPAYAGTWDHPRGNAANTGFADVATAPAVLLAFPRS